jgi:Family of unknown function (DUF6399)/Winged helix-turn-helix DNA-binding
MKINIRERGQKVLQCLKEAVYLSRRDIAKALGISKSSVQRHLTSQLRRQQYPESHFWETTEGQNWLRLLVFGVIYCFGIKCGVGASSLSNFFHLLRLEQHIGCSPSSLRTMEVQVKAKIIDYEQEQSKACHSEAPISICVGADETFFGLPILVAIELSSGFIFSKVECENRTYETWWNQISSWFNPEQWNCRFMVSDGARALVKLALDGLKCPTVPDVFHMLRDFSKSIGGTIGLQQARLQKEYMTLKAKSSSNSNAQILVVEAQQLQLENDHNDYRESIHALSQSIHPFHIETGESQMGMELQASLQPHLSILERLSQTYSPTKSEAALERWKRQIPCLAGGLHAWWVWVLQALTTQTQDPEIHHWVLNCLLPWVYWHEQTQKTRQPQLKQNYEQAAKSAQERFLADDCTKNLTSSEQQTWIDWAIWMCAKFQRTSSAVEGRNGYLSGLHHSSRGFTEQTLKVLTIIHNFDIKRDDGTTAAQRLFEKQFPDLFEWIVPRMGELPRPRRTFKTPKSKKPTPSSVPL